MVMVGGYCYCCVVFEYMFRRQRKIVERGCSGADDNDEYVDDGNWW